MKAIQDYTEYSLSGWAVAQVLGGGTNPSYSSESTTVSAEESGMGKCTDTRYSTSYDDGTIEQCTDYECEE